jgi:hypothetical protein
MAKPPKLTDMQLVLLSSASQRQDGNFFPVADSVKGKTARVTKAIEDLIGLGYAEEGEVGAQVPSWREDGDRRIGVAITDAGKSAIDGGEPVTGGGGEGNTAPPPQPNSPAAAKGAVRAGTKQALLADMLQSDEGATIQQIVDVTGWLPHTTRAALTGLKKRGFEISSEKGEGVTRYRAKRLA